MRFVERETNYVLDETLEGALPGMRVRVTRLTERLDHDVSVIVPHAYRLPLEILRMEATTADDHTIIHRSCATRGDAESWALDTTRRIMVANQPSTFHDPPAQVRHDAAPDTIYDTRTGGRRADDDGR